MTIDVLMIGLRHIYATQGGIETHVRHLAEELDRLGVNVAVAVRPDRNLRCIGSSVAARPSGPHTEAGEDAASQGWPERRRGIRLVSIWSLRLAAFDAIVHSFLCVLYAAVVRPRILHVHAIGPSLVVPLARLFGLRVVATHHGEDYRREKWGWAARLVLRCGEIAQAGFANRILCVSQPLTERLKRRYRCDYTYIPNGIAVSGTVLPTAILQELGLTHHRYILTVGRIVPEKRHFDLMTAFSEARMPGMKLVIVGLGENGSRYAADVVKAASVTPGVVMAGFREGADLDALYAHAALFALPSSHEGLPIVLLEAMAQRCEMLVSDIEAHRALKLPAAAYHPVGDIERLSEGLRLASRQAALRGERRDWSARLSAHRWPRIARQVLEVFRSLDDRIGTAETTPQPYPSPNETSISTSPCWRNRRRLA